MNTQIENKYERYALHSEWNLTKTTPKKASCFIVCDDAIRGLKMLYGEPLDPNNPEILNLPRDWGIRNDETITLWFQKEKLSAAHKVELGMIDLAFYPTVNDTCDTSDSDDDST